MTSIEERLASPKLTPMMRQYLTVKAAHPTAIVLFRMGDFFETFFDDAKECAELLDITLTARSKERDIPMAGVPHHAIEGYLARLIDLGRTVVLVDQVEDPKQAKGLVRREVTRILSPGTYLDPNAPARTATYLVAISFRPKPKRKRKLLPNFGLAALDLATGEFRATSGDEDDALLDEIARLGAKEVLVPEAERARPVVQRIVDELPRVTITPIETPDTGYLATHFGKAEVKGLGEVLPPEALDAASVALKYAADAELRPETPNLRGEASLSHIEVLRPYVPGEALVLDAQATTHLELLRTQGDGSAHGSLLGALDEAATSMGGRLLGRWLLYPLRDPNEIAARQDAVAALIAAPTALDRVRETIQEVGDIERLVGRVVMGRANPRDLSMLAATLARAPDLLAAAGDAAAPRPRAPLDTENTPPSVVLQRLARTDAAQDVGRMIAEALVDDPPVDLEKAASVFADGYDKTLDGHADLSRNGKAKIQALEAAEREATGISSLKVRYNKVFGYFIEVTKSNLSLVPEDRYVRKQTTVNSERFFTQELKELETAVLNAEEHRVARTVELFDVLITKVAREVRRLRALAAALAELDVLSTFARLAERRDWVRPVVDDSLAIEIADGRHPVIEQLSVELGERFVPNDVSVDENERLVIITGPNMAGKSTIMRQTALIVILAHMGSFVPARSARIGLVDRVFTRVGASDDLSRGRSTFMVEMTETARILRSATERSLILLDEIGRGTSTFDGLSIAWAVAEHLHDHVSARTLFATHYHELTEICRDKTSAVNRHVAVKEWNDEIVFLRKLLPGATNRSYGVQVARLAGLPASVLARAKSVLASLEAQALSAGDHSAVTHLARSRKGSGQMHLFEAAPSVDVASEPERAVLDELRALSVDDITPRQALDLLAQLAERLDSDIDPS